MSRTNLVRLLPAILIGIVLSLVTAAVVYWLTFQRDSIHFNNVTNELENQINSRFQNYANILLDTRAFFRASEKVTFGEFERFISETELLRRYPGIQGVGFTIRLLPDEVKKHETKMRRFGFKNYKVWPEYPRDEYFSIVHLIPRDWRNERAVGYDMFTEKVRHEAMTRARDTGEPAASGIVTLVQETKEQPQKGFLIYVPYYQKEYKPASLEERRKTLRGFIYAPFRVGDFIKAAVGAKHEKVEFEIFDGEQLTADTLLFDSDNHLDADGKKFSRHMRTSTLTIAGRKWTINFFSPPSFGSPLNQTAPILTLVLGLLITAWISQVTLNRNRQKAAEEIHLAQERADREFIKTILDTTRAVIIGLDRNGRIKFLNRFAEEVCGIKIEEALDKNWIELFVPEEQRGGVNQTIDNLRSKKTNQLENFIVSRRGGMKRLISWNNASIQDSKGEIQLIIGTGTDITDRKAIEEERSRLLEKSTMDVENLRIEREMRERFVAALSHDLRNSLTAIRSNAQLIEHFPERVPIIQKCSTGIVHIVDRADSMLQDMLDVSRIRAGHPLPLQIERLNLRDLIQDIVAEIAVIQRERIVLETASVSEVYWSRQSIRRILDNLVNNAFKYGSPTSPVTITAKQTDDHVHISVHNSGNPLNEEELKRVFEPFWQSQPASKSGKAGWGLGLTLVRGLTEAHGGRVSVESSTTEGTTFSVELPQDARPYLKAAA